MFNPSREEVRRFFAEAWSDLKANRPLEGARRTAAEIIARHPEYHALLESGAAALQQDYVPEGGVMNPFLHLSLHLAVEEQLSIDQPPGIRECYLALLRRRQDEHAAQHEVVESLAEVIWRSQRDAVPLDSAAYLSLLRQRAAIGEDPDEQV